LHKDAKPPVRIEAHRIGDAPTRHREKSLRRWLRFVFISITVPGMEAELKPIPDPLGLRGCSTGDHPANTYDYKYCAPSIKIAFVSGFKEEPDYSVSLWRGLMQHNSDRFSLTAIACNKRMKGMFHPFHIFRMIRKSRPDLVHVQNEINFMAVPQEFWDFPFCWVLSN
jgi:hypothetical protein